MIEHTDHRQAIYGPAVRIATVDVSLAEFAAAAEAANAGQMSSAIRVGGASYGVRWSGSFEAARIGTPPTHDGPWLRLSRRGESNRYVRMVREDDGSGSEVAIALWTDEIFFMSGRTLRAGEVSVISSD